MAKENHMVKMWNNKNNNWLPFVLMFVCVKKFVSECKFVVNTKLHACTIYIFIEKRTYKEIKCSCVFTWRKKETRTLAWMHNMYSVQCTICIFYRSNSLNFDTSTPKRKLCVCSVSSKEDLLGKILSAPFLGNLYTPYFL